MELSQEEKLFWEFFSGILKSRSIFQYFEKKKMVLIAYVFPKLWTGKDIVT